MPSRSQATTFQPPRRTSRSASRSDDDARIDASVDFAVASVTRRGVSSRRRHAPSRPRRHMSTPTATFDTTFKSAAGVQDARRRLQSVTTQTTAVLSARGRLSTLFPGSAAPDTSRKYTAAARGLRRTDEGMTTSRSDAVRLRISLRVDCSRRMVAAGTPVEMAHGPSDSHRDRDCRTGCASQPGESPRAASGRSDGARGRGFGEPPGDTVPDRARHACSYRRRRRCRPAVSAAGVDRPRR